MIHLLYLKEKLPKSVFQHKLTKEVFSNLSDHDLVIFPFLNNLEEYADTLYENQDKTLYFKHSHQLYVNSRIIDAPSIDWEIFQSANIKNIFLIHFLQFQNKYVQKIISAKSKKSQIIGIEKRTPAFPSLHLQIHNYRQLGMNDDELSIFLILKEGMGPDATHLIFENAIISNKDSDVKEIEEVSNLNNYIKH